MAHKINKRVRKWVIQQFEKGMTEEEILKETTVQSRPDVSMLFKIRREAMAKEFLNRITEMKNSGMSLDQIVTETQEKLGIQVTDDVMRIINSVFVGKKL